MAKQHRDFVTYIRNGVEINALVATSRDAGEEERLTVVYLDPESEGGIYTGEQLRNSIRVEFGVAPLAEGQKFGWKDVAAADVAGSGSGRWGGSDWTAMGQDKDGFPVPKGSPEDVSPAEREALQQELDRTKQMLAESEDLVAIYKAEIEAKKPTESSEEPQQ